MKVFITGGTGFVGSHIAEEVKNRGHELVALVRRIGSLPKAEEILGDVTRPETFPPEKLAGCQAAIHLVGIIREFPRQGITFERIHVEGTRNVLEACRRAGLNRLLHTSALGRGRQSGARYQHTKAEAEDLVRASGLNWTIFRPSSILGRGGEFLEIMRSHVRLGVVPLPGGGRYLMAPVAISTVAKAYTNALEQEGAIGKTYELGGDPLSYRSLMEKIALKTKRRPFYVNVPLRPLQMMALIMDQFSFFPVTREQLIMLKEKALPSDNSVYEELGLEYMGIEGVVEEALSGRPS